MITFLILPPSRPLRASTSRLAPILPRRPADYHLRPYPTLLHHYPTYATTRPSTLPLLVLYPTTTPRQLWVPALPPPIPTYHTSPSSSTTHPYPTTTPRQPWEPALAPPIPTYHTSPSSSSSTSTTRPYPTTPSRQLWVLALAPPIPTYHTSPSTSTTQPYPTTALWQSFPTYFIRLISPIRPIRLITPL